MHTEKLAPCIVLISILFWTFGQTASAQIKLDVGGYMQNWYIANQSVEKLESSLAGGVPTTSIHSEDINGFRIRRARLTARGQINDTFSVTTWIEFAGSTPSLLDFHIDMRFRPWFNLRVGQFIMPGQSHDTSRLSSSRLIFYERSPITTRLSSVMGFTAFRDIGVMAYGQHGRLWYGIHAGNGGGRFVHAGSTITERKAGGGLYGARVDYTLVDGLTLGGHVSTNQQRNVVRPGIATYDYDRSSWSLRLATNDFGIDGLFTQFEYMSLKADDENIGFQGINDGEYLLHGFYGEIGYKLTRQWHILARYDEMIEKPRQLSQHVIALRTQNNNYTVGLSRFIYNDGGAEIARIHLNYSFGETGPVDLNNSILVAVFQLRFIP